MKNLGWSRFTTYLPAKCEGAGSHEDKWLENWAVVEIVTTFHYGDAAAITQRLAAGPFTSQADAQTWIQENPL